MPFGSVEPWAYSALELSIAAVAFLWLYRLYLFPSNPVVWSPLYLPAVVFLALMGMQLVPMPREALKLLSPKTAAFYDQTVPGYAQPSRAIAVKEASLAGEPSPQGAPRLPISQTPYATRTYLLKGIAFTLFLFLVLNSFRGPGQVRWLLYAFVLSGAFQAFYGLIEYLSGHQHIFAYQKKYYTDAATGTLINRNHFAGFLEMTLLVALGLLFSRLREPHRHSAWRERLLSLTDRQASLNLALLLCIGIVIIALVLSYSRTGIILGLSAAGAFSLTQLRRQWSFTRTVLVAMLALIVLVPAYGVGYWTLTGRYAILTQEFSNPGGRLTVWEDSLRIFRDFPLLGTGAGTFQYVFPRYRDVTVTAFYDYAHNDYVQTLGEMGAAGGLILGWGLFAAGQLWVRRQRENQAIGILRLAIGFGLLAVALHETVDFGLQIPSNLLALTSLVGSLSLVSFADESSPASMELDHA